MLDSMSKIAEVLELPPLAKQKNQASAIWQMLDSLCMYKRNLFFSSSQCCILNNKIK